MKKFFTLLGAAFIAVSGMQMDAAQPNVTLIGPKKTAAEFSQILEPINYETQKTQKRVIKRSWESGQFKYDCYFVNQGVLTDWWGFTMGEGEAAHPATFEDLPYWALQIQIVRNRKTNPSEATQSLYNFLVTWPSKGRLEAPAYYDDYDYTDENAKIASLEDFASVKDPYAHFLVNQDVDNNSIYNILPVYVKNEDDSETFAGYPMWGKLITNFFSNINGTKYQIANVSELSHFNIGSAKDGMNSADLKMTMALSFVNVDNDSDIQTLEGDWDGEVVCMDMKALDFTYNFDEFHVFNGGILKSLGDYDEVFPYPFQYKVDGSTSFDPVNQFYYFGCEKPGYLFIKDGAKAFDPDNIKYTTDDKNIQADQIRYARGGFFSNDDQFENKKFNMLMPEYYQYKDPFYGDQTILLMTPEPGSLVPGGYSDTFGDWSGIYGSYGAAAEYNRYFSEGTYLAFNTPNGIAFSAADNVGNLYHGNFSGKVIYHYDPTDMNLTREIGPLTGELDPEAGVVNVKADADFTVRAANGQINVMANGQNVRLFNLEGRLVGSAKGNASFNVAKGLYIVVVGKTAKKVIL